MRRLRRAVALMLAGTTVVASARPCPGDAAPRAAGTLLTVQAGPSPARRYDAAALAALPAGSWTQRRQVAASGAVPSEQSVTWGGFLLRDVLTDAGFGRPAGPRSEPTTVVEAVATDGWRALFSWGELFNHALGDQVVVVIRQDGRALDTHAGPLALRSLGDLRAGPRHVRKLCALRLRALD